MRILFKGVVHPTTLAKSLKHALAVHGLEVGIRTCEQHIAGMTGYANWHELQVVSERQPLSSPNDQVAGPEVAYARKQQYVGFLAGVYGIPTAKALVDAIRPTGSGPGNGLQPEGARRTVGRAFPFPDGIYPYAFAHRVTTDRGPMLMRSEGKVRIPASVPGAGPSFTGDFVVPKQSQIPRPTLTRLEIHAVEGSLYSRLEPILTSRLPVHFGRADELLDILLWRKEPAYGVAGNPLDQALNIWRHGRSANLRDHVCPPNWEMDFHNGSRDIHYMHAALYGGLHSLPFRGAKDADIFDRMERLEADGPPAVASKDSLVDKGVRILSSDGDRIGRQISEAVDGALAIVGEEVMLLTPEPCWRLAMTKGGDLRLDLFLHECLGGMEGLDPALFFALDEKDACDRAVEDLLASAPKPRLRTRGNLASFDPSACRIDGYANTIVYLMAGLRESLHHAQKVLPQEAAQAASALLAGIPKGISPGIVDFVNRSEKAPVLPDGLLDGWNRLIDLAGDGIVTDSTSPWLARLAGHGAVLIHVARELRYDLTPTGTQPGPSM